MNHDKPETHASRRVVFQGALLALVCSAACVEGASPSIQAPKIDRPPPEQVDPLRLFSPDEPGNRLVRDDVIGVSFVLPAGFEVKADPYLWETYGVRVVEPHEKGGRVVGHAAIARIALDWDARPEDLDAIVAQKEAELPHVPLQRGEAVVDGHRAVTLGPIPGAQVSTNLYLAAHGRVYRVLWYGEGLDEKAEALLATLRFFPPTRDVASLGLLPAGSDLARFGAPRPDLADVPPPSLPPPSAPLLTNAIVFGEEVLPNGCVTQPSSFFVQTLHTSDANGSGWSKMGTPNFWGRRTHGSLGLGRCFSTFYTNDYYAIDYYLDEGDELYSPFAEAYVSYAGWDPENWDAYGNMVVLYTPDGRYWSLSAHLSFVNVVPGQYVDADTLIGWAGSTGYADPYPHLHQAFYAGAQTNAGRPFGGRGMKPTRLSHLGDGGGAYAYFHDKKWVSW